MDAENQAAHDETRALVLSLVEVLAKKLAPGSFLALLSRDDVEKLMKRKAEMVQQFEKERRDAASRLVLPPGARS
jgi:hypothetical protein